MREIRFHFKEQIEDLVFRELEKNLRGWGPWLRVNENLRSSIYYCLESRVAKETGNIENKIEDGIKKLQK